MFTMVSVYNKLHVRDLIIAVVPLIKGEIESYFNWTCNVSDEVHQNCALKSCGYQEEATQHFFYNGRSPSGAHLPRESLRLEYKGYI